MKDQILVVDDEQDIRDLAKTLLEKAGFSVSEAVNGKDCIKKISKKKFNLILLDIMMPGMHPNQVLDGIRHSGLNKNTKVCYFSIVEYASKEKSRLLKNRNIVGYIQKPFKEEDFISIVQSFLKKNAKR